MTSIDILKKRRSDPGTYETIFALNDKYGFFKKNKKVLDVGCGAGSFLYAIKDQVGERYGCDFNIEQYAEDENKQNIVRVDFDHTTLPYEEKSFDTICILDVLEHIYNPMAVLANSFRVLKDDGMIVISTPNVHNFINRIVFAWNGSLKGFWDSRQNRSNGERHITPVFYQTLEQFCMDNNCSIVAETYNRTIIPIVRIHLPIKNRFLSETVIWVCKKNQ